MPTNSRSEELWEVLVETEALVKTDGFVPTHEPFAAGESSSRNWSAGAVPLDDILSRYRDRLALGTDWPTGSGSRTPLALILTETELGEQEREFVRSWFENPRAACRLQEDFWIQPLPPFAGEHAPFIPYFQDLCTLLRPKALFSLGALPAQRLLSASLSLATLRSSDYQFGTWSLVTTLNPSTYFEIPKEDAQQQTTFKGQVWKDVQRLLGKIRYER